MTDFGLRLLIVRLIKPILFTFSVRSVKANAKREQKIGGERQT